MWVAKCQRLGHHAAHRIPGHRRPLQLQGIQHPGDVVGHLLDLVALPQAVRFPVIALIDGDEPVSRRQQRDQAVPDKEGIVAQSVDEH